MGATMLDASPVTISQRIADLRAKAHSGGLPVRRSDAKLYDLLGQCLTLCEDILREGREGELRDATREARPEGETKRRGRYAQSGSDAYTLVARSVLQAHDAQPNYSRYASVMRSAAKLGISGADLAQWLAENGGARSLYRTAADSGEHRLWSIQLVSPVALPTGAPFTLTLVSDGAMHFRVLSINSATEGQTHTAGEPPQTKERPRGRV